VCLGPNPGALAPRARKKPGWVLGAGVVAPSRCEGPGYHPRKIYENSDAKSCILVTTCFEISCFFANYGQYIVGPQSKSWGDQSPPVPRVVAPMVWGDFSWGCTISFWTLNKLIDMLNNKFVTRKVGN